MPPLSDTLPPPRRAAAGEPMRRKRPQPAAPTSALRRKPLQILLGFVTAVLLLDALVGERGLVERLRARREYQELAASLAAARAENERLREQMRGLTEDSATIESLAREELGLLRPGEVLFIVKDARPAQ